MLGFFYCPTCFNYLLKYIVGGNVCHKYVRQNLLIAQSSRHAYLHLP